ALEAPHAVEWTPGRSPRPARVLHALRYLVESLGDLRPCDELAEADMHAHAEGYVLLHVFALRIELAGMIEGVLVAARDADREEQDCAGRDFDVAIGDVAGRHAGDRRGREVAEVLLGDLVAEVDVLGAALVDVGL